MNNLARFDTATVAGIITLSALAVLIIMRRGFSGINVKLGD